MFDEFYKTIKSYLYERTTSPLSGAFIISWCLWNYEVILYIFSSLTPQEKIQNIESELTLVQSVVLPLITTALFIFVYPYPSKFAYKFWRQRQKELREERLKIDEESLLTKEESRTIKREMYKLEAEFKKEIEQKDLEIRGLKELLALQTKEVIEPSYNEMLGTMGESGKFSHSDMNENKLVNLDKDIENLLLEIGNTPDGFLVEINYLRNSPSRVRAEHLRDLLLEKDYIVKDYNQKLHELVLTLTTKGRKYLVENKLV